MWPAYIKPAKKTKSNILTLAIIAFEPALRKHKGKVKTQSGTEKDPTEEIYSGVNEG